MKREQLRGLLKAILIGSMVQIATQAHAQLPERSPAMALPTGQYITPTFVRGSVQQFLNPGLAAHPNYVAGEAVRSQLSPDGTTLAVLCAGYNSLANPDGTLDAASSTQFIFLYNVAGANKTHPALLQVIQQANSHVGLVFSPDG